MGRWKSDNFMKYYIRKHTQESTTELLKNMMKIEHFNHIPKDKKLQLERMVKFDVTKWERGEMVVSIAGSGGELGAGQSLLKSLLQPILCLIFSFIFYFLFSLLYKNHSQTHRKSPGKAQVTNENTHSSIPWCSKSGSQKPGMNWPP